MANHRKDNMSEIIATYKGFLIFKTKDGFEVKHPDLHNSTGEFRPLCASQEDAMELIDEMDILKYVQEEA